MARLRQEPAPPSATESGAALEARILQTRGVISPLYRVLLNSPPVADGWERLLTAIRQQTTLSPPLRELVILRIAVINRVDYEFDAHTSQARGAGLSDEKIAAIRTSDFSIFNDVERTVLDYTDTMTRDVQVPDDLFDRVRSAFDPTGVVDLTATIAAYNMVSRFLAALHVQ